MTGTVDINIRENGVDYVITGSTYTVNGKTVTVTDDTPHYEWLVKVDDPNADFIYTVTKTDKNGNTSNYGGGTLKTIANSHVESKVTVGKSSMPAAQTKIAPTVVNTKQFTPFDLVYGVQGSNKGQGVFRFVCKKAILPGELQPSKEDLIGLKVTGTLTDGAASVPFESYIVDFEDRSGTEMVLVVRETADVKATVYDSNQGGQTHKFLCKITPQD